MARKRMVTRTVTITTATALCLNVETAEPENVTLDIPGKFGSDGVLLDHFGGVYNTDKKKAVTIVSKEEKEVKYGMTESDFIKQAEVITEKVEQEDKDNE
mgnify:CR=1 FL=1